MELTRLPARVPTACCSEAPARCGGNTVGAVGAGLARCELYAFDEMQHVSAIVAQPAAEASLAAFSRRPPKHHDWRSGSPRLMAGPPAIAPGSPARSRASTRSVCLLLSPERRPRRSRGAARAPRWTSSPVCERVRARASADAEVITIAALAIAAVATQSRLRAADAAYVWTARRVGVALVTADEELVKRSGVLCSVERA